MQLRSSSISSAPSKATSMRVLEGRESNFRSLRPALRITCLRVRTSLPRDICMQFFGFVLPAAIDNLLVQSICWLFGDL